MYVQWLDGDRRDICLMVGHYNELYQEKGCIRNQNGNKDSIRATQGTTHKYKSRTNVRK